MIKIRRKKGNKFTRYGIICIILVSFLNVLGVGYGYWADKISLQSTISTGNIDPVFVESTITQINSGVEAGKTEVPFNGKNMNIQVNNAQANSTYIVNYTVKNNGQIPVKCEPVNPNVEGIFIENEMSDIVDSGCTGKGSFMISLVNAKEKSYVFDLNLVFKQWK